MWNIDRVGGRKEWIDIWNRLKPQSKDWGSCITGWQAAPTSHTCFSFVYLSHILPPHFSFLLFKLPLTFLTQSNGINLKSESSCCLDYIPFCAYSSFCLNYKLLSLYKHILLPGKQIWTQLSSKFWYNVNDNFSPLISLCDVPFRLLLLNTAQT